MRKSDAKRQQRPPRPNGSTRRRRSDARDPGTGHTSRQHSAHRPEKKLTFRHRDRCEPERERQRKRQTDRQRERERDRETERQRETERETDRETDRQTDRQTDRDRDRQRQRQRETETEMACVLDTRK